MFTKQKKITDHGLALVKKLIRKDWKIKYDCQPYGIFLDKPGRYSVCVTSKYLILTRKEKIRETDTNRSFHVLLNGQESLDVIAEKMLSVLV